MRLTKHKISYSKIIQKKLNKPKIIKIFVARILYKIFTTFSSYSIIFNIDQYKDYQ